MISNILIACPAVPYKEMPLFNIELECLPDDMLYTAISNEYEIIEHTDMNDRPALQLALVMADKTYMHHIYNPGYITSLAVVLNDEDPEGDDNGLDLLSCALFNSPGRVPFDINLMTIAKKSYNM